MPKEVIVTRRDVFGPTSGAAQAIEIRWGRRDSVEMGARIVYAVDSSVDYVPTEEERPGSGGKAIPGFWTDLSRPQINQLIRILRRARNQAFGEDE